MKVTLKYYFWRKPTGIEPIIQRQSLPNQPMTFSWCE